MKEKYSSESTLIRETERIENIIEYSSYFRTSESKDLFESIKNTTNIEKLVNSSIQQNQNPIAKALVDNIFADFKKNINYSNLI